MGTQESSSVSASSMSTDGFTEVELDSDVGFKVHHKVVGNYLQLILEIADTTNRWMGFGFAEQESGHMKGSDMVTVSVDEDGATVDDRYATFTSSTYDSGSVTYVGLTAEKDTYNDWTILDAHYSLDGSTHTSQVHISRRLETGDNQDRDIGLGSRRVVWAYGSSTTVAYHGSNRGSTTMNFRPIPDGETSPDSVDNAIVEADYDGYYDYEMDDYALSGGTTEYVCQSFSLPVDARRSVRAIQVINQNTDTNVAHHGLLHICTDNAYFDAHASPTPCSGDHSSPGFGHQTSECAGLMYSWAVGMNDFVLPDDVGFPIGSGDTDIKFVILELHYDNPTGDNTITDNFGLRLFYNDGPPTLEMGVMVIGDVAVQSNNAGIVDSLSADDLPFALGPIPASTAKTLRQGTCPGTCTSEFEDAEVTVLSSFLHMHYYGHKVILEHYDEDNNFIATRGRIDFWDNGYQHQLEGSDHSFTWKAGEALHAQCYYDSSTSSSEVVFGGTTAEEMCMIFINYYPRQFRGVNSDGDKLELSACGLSANAYLDDLAQTCGGTSMDSSVTSPYVGDYTTDQIDGEDVYEDPEGKMESESTHTCYPSASSDTGLSTAAIIGIAVGGGVGVLGLGAFAVYQSGSIDYSKALVADEASDNMEANGGVEIVPVDNVDDAASA